MAKRAAIYARVSTIVGQSPAMQLDVLREFAARRGFDVVTEFIDHGASGARERRPALDKLMDAARKRAFDVVLVYRFDRFARSVRHLIAGLDEFDALGIDFVSYGESLDTSTPMGRAMFSIIGALGELERNLIVERSIEGQRRARAGARCSRRASASSRRRGADPSLPRRGQEPASDRKGDRPFAHGRHASRARSGLKARA